MESQCMSYIVLITGDEDTLRVLLDLGFINKLHKQLLLLWPLGEVLTVDYMIDYRYLGTPFVIYNLWYVEFLDMFANFTLIFSTSME